MTVWILLLVVLLGILGFGLVDKGQKPSNLYIPADASQAEDTMDAPAPITRYLSESEDRSDSTDGETKDPLQVYRWQNDEGDWALSNSPPGDDRPYQMVDYSGEQLISSPDQTSTN